MKLTNTLLKFGVLRKFEAVCNAYHFSDLILELGNLNSIAPTFKLLPPRQKSM